MHDYYAGFPEKSFEFVNNEIRKEKIISTALIHHYAFRSEQSFHDRVRRGLGGAFASQTIWRDLAEGANFENFLATVNAVVDESLAWFWPDVRRRARQTIVTGGAGNQEEKGGATGSVTSPGLPPECAESEPRSLLSRGKPATQSSISRWSVGRTKEEDASGALKGVIDGTGKFHTDLEETPWWMVDLESSYKIEEIRIYNRMEPEAVRQRACRFAVDIGHDPVSLNEIFRKEDDILFGGVDGRPFVWRANHALFGRFVRIRLLAQNFLHFDQVEIYGRPFKE